MARTGFAAALLAGAIAAGVAAEPSVPDASPPPILFAADNAPALGGDLFRLGANGRRVNLTNSPFADEYPLVSPNGERVAFVSNRSGSPGIYVVGIDGRGLQRLDPPPHQIGASSLEPQLVSMPAELFAVPAAGRAPRDLHVSGITAAWGPTRIAYVQDARQPASLWTTRPDGSDPQKLANVRNAQLYGSSLAWSADGRLAFGDQSSERRPWNRTATYDVYSLRTDGSDVRRLTTNVDAYTVSWRR